MRHKRSSDVLHQQRRCTVRHGYDPPVLEFPCDERHRRCALNCSIKELEQFSPITMQAPQCSCLPSTLRQSKNPLHALRQSTFALLLRGESYRWGCDGFGVRAQMHAVLSHAQHVGAPLEAAGHTMHTYLPFRRGVCGGQRLRELVVQAYRSPSSRSTTPRAVTVAPHLLDAPDQSAGMRGALNWFVATSQAQAHDFVIVMRFDVVLNMPIDRWWGSNVMPRVARFTDLRDTVSLASRCEYIAWKRFNCSSDLIFVVSRKHLASFNASIGAVDVVDARALRIPAGSNTLASFSVWRRRLSHCCFSQNLTSSNTSSAQCSAHLVGHGCYNVLGRKIGYRKIRFLFPMPNESVGNHPKYYLLGPSVNRSRPALQLHVPHSMPHSRHADAHAQRETPHKHR